MHAHMFSVGVCKSGQLCVSVGPGPSRTPPPRARVWGRPCHFTPLTLRDSAPTWGDFSLILGVSKLRLKKGK